MGEVNEAFAQLIKDREYWQLKYEKAIRELQGFNEANTGLTESYVKCGEYVRSLKAQIAENEEQYIKRLAELVAEKADLLVANDVLEDTITNLKVELEGYEEEQQSNNWNRQKLKRIEMISRSAL